MKLVIDQFSGIVPRYADRLLQDNQASFVTNLKPTSGDLRGFRSLLLEARFAGGATYRRAIKLYYPDSDTFVWFLSEDVNADVVQSPLATDTFNRVYYTDIFHTYPQITTLDDIAAHTPSTNLGVVTPLTAPVVAHTGGVGALDIRAYTYLYVDKYGSPSAPSPPTLANGKVDDTWVISVATPPAGVVFVDIYRSASGNESSGQYYRVGRVATPFAPFTDTLTNDQVPFQLPLGTFGYNPAPAGMQGLVQHSSGALVGFYGRTVHFSQPYLPHAWPDEFRYVLANEIVGIAAISNSIVALTKAFPVILSGTRPDGISIVQLTDQEPCQSKRSIVVMNKVVIFASPNGLVSITTAGLSRPLNPLLTNTEFERYSPTTIVAATYGPYYIAFYAASQGFAAALPPYEPVSFVPLDRYSDVTGVDTDRRSGELLVTQTNKTSRFDKTQDRRFATTWRSKEFILPKPYNFGAYQILFRQDQTDATAAALVAAATAYNLARFAEGPLDTIGAYAIGGEFDMDFEALDPILGGLPPIQPLGGEPLYDVGAVSGAPNIRFDMTVDGKVRHSQIVVDEKVHGMIDTYKGTRYFLQVSGSASVQRIVVAQDGQECAEA